MNKPRNVDQIQSEYAELHKDWVSKRIGWAEYINQKSKLIEEIGNRGMINEKIKAEANA
jgi:hypothetical protein